MTIRSLFNIILKILGIFFIKDFLSMIPELLSVGLFMTKADTVTEGIWTLLSTLMIFFVYGLVSYYLIFKSDLIIDKLKLDEGFEQETIALNVHRSTILSISIIVIGGYMIANEIPNFCKQLFLYFQEKRLTYGQTKPAMSYTIVSGVRIVIGILLIAEQRRIVNFIERQRKK